MIFFKLSHIYSNKSLLLYLGGKVFLSFLGILVTLWAQKLRGEGGIHQLRC